MRGLPLAAVIAGVIAAKRGIVNGWNSRAGLPGHVMTMGLRRAPNRSITLAKREEGAPCRFW